ncbi:MAG TPA: DNA-binding domain-containing protein [Roseiarcus sp.]|nr:DNA-binding domain-containing protein [Roseiarcus sp.]
MSFETTVRAFAAALGEPSAPPPAATHGRMGAPDVRRFAVYRNNVAVRLIGALEARYPVSRRIAGDDLFRAMARAFVRAHRPRSPVMIAYGEEFPEFVADYLAPAGARPSLRQTALEITDASLRRVSSPLAGEGQGVGSRRPMRQGSGHASDNLLGQRDPPPLPAPTRGDGCANGVDSAGWHQAAAAFPDVARLENAWVEAYHSEDASVATVGELGSLSLDCLPRTRIAFHPAARLLRFATPAATIWASAQASNGSFAPTERLAEDALITRPDCDVRVRVLPLGGYDFALKMQEGATLIEAFTALDDPAFDFGTHLVGLVESGAVASIIPGPAQ